MASKATFKYGYKRSSLLNPVTFEHYEVFLDTWITRALRSRLPPLRKFAKTLRAHEPLILNWFIFKKAFSSAAVEGLNNKVRVVTRRSYGFKSFHVLEIVLYHTLGKLPEPELTHKF